MKLLALHLTNVRKFTGKRASITGIGDGLTVVSEANEFGKSTFFDAIHALFFEKYSATAKTVKSLQPYAGGAVEVAAEVETDQGVFRVEKRFLSRKGAKIIRQSDAAIVAQDDEAERWIKEVLGQDGTGPAGLLWVRQGLVGLEPDAAAEKALLIDTRRDLLSSVAGEIDAMTGGRRMDRVMRRVAQDLSEITTATGKKSGAWKTAAEDVAQLEQDLALVTEQVRDLDAALTARKQAESTLTRLDDPVAKARREAARKQAQDAMDAATAQSQKMATARGAQDLAALHAKNATRELSGFLTAVDSLTAAEAEAEAAKQAARDADAIVARRRADHDTAQSAQDASALAVATTRKQLEAARQQIDARKAKGDAARLTDLIAKATAAMAGRDAARARVTASKATSAWLADVDKAGAALQTLEATVQAQSTTLSMAYTGAVQLRLNGAAVPADHPIALDALSEIDIPGVGRMTLRAPSSGRAAKHQLATAQSRLIELLALAGAETLDQARQLASARQDAARTASGADDMLDLLAPDGIDALRQALAEAALAAKLADDAPLPALADLDSALSEALATDTNAQQAHSRAAKAHAAARDVSIRSHAAVAAADKALNAARGAVGAEDNREARRTALLLAVAQTDTALSAAKEAVAELATDARDLATAEAELTRATDAIDSTAALRAKTDRTLAELSSKIEERAGNGIEERCSELEGKLLSAQATELGLARRAAALTCLRDALSAQRNAARDTYFGPVQAELTPLLSILHRNATLSFDSKTLLPSGLTRDLDDETLDNLSGGTREQIAILTRLAFARLFAKQGRRMPIVLDDALVYSDDDRIIKMFTALTRVAQDQQILVFSCRQLAFQDLGGARPMVTVSDA
ncbi:AAA family ATPase [Pseudoruegeria sp. SK021]|uniref:AAA family ATPase n=1 Tax=Pseudoruegeria sp. SK021 TaxID=1933035 RepID=UPI000A239CA0|nr:AAA family ATPase [Pseudoruegeria sp. SK021]OSP54367.1 hypothetical protein BV911_12865 [Pseudoruegeria sp. SK021]